MNAEIWTIIGSAATLLAFFYTIMRNFKSDLDKRFDKIEEKFSKIEMILERMESKIIDLDKRLYAVETMLHMKDCCILKHDEGRKVE